MKLPVPSTHDAAQAILDDTRHPPGWRNPYRGGRGVDPVPDDVAGVPDWFSERVAMTEAGSYLAGAPSLEGSEPEWKAASMVVLPSIVGVVSKILSNGNRITVLTEGTPYDPDTTAKPTDSSDLIAATVAKSVKALGVASANYATWDDDPVNVYNPKSPVWDRLEHATGDLDIARAAIAARMLVVGATVEDLREVGMLDARSALKFEELTGRPVPKKVTESIRRDLRSVVYPHEFNAEPTVVSAVSDLYDSMRASNLLRKIHEVEVEGGVAIAMVPPWMGYALKPVIARLNERERRQRKQASMDLEMAWGWNARVAAKINEIMSGISPKVTSGAKSVTPKLKRADPNNAMWTYAVPGSKGETYTVRIKGLPKGNLRNVSKMDVRVSCTCPFFRYQGPEHWAKVGDYLYGKPAGTAAKPNQKDPDGGNRVCKHVVAVFNRAGNFVYTPPKTASDDLEFNYDRSLPPEGNLKGLSSKTSANLKQSGVFQAPPRLVSEIEDWMIPLYAGQVLAWGEDFIAILGDPYNMPKEYEAQALQLFGRGRTTDWQNKIRDILKEARKFAPTGKYITRPEEMLFLINNSVLKGWRYEHKVPPKASSVLRAIGKDKILVWYDPHLASNIGGHWIPRLSKLSVRAQPMPSSPEMFYGHVNELRRIIRHEVQHVGQTLLSAFIGSNDAVAGLPGRPLREKGHDPYGTSLDGGAGLDHALRDVEYHTRLQDEIDRFAALALKVPQEELLRVLKKTTGISQEHISKYEFGVDVPTQEFFFMLKALNKPKWRRAVADFLVGVEAAGVPLYGKAAFNRAGNFAYTPPKGKTAATTPVPDRFDSSEAGLLTRDEYLDHINKNQTTHPSSAYNFTSFKMNEGFARHHIGTVPTRQGPLSVHQSTTGMVLTDEDGRAVAVIHNGTLFHEPRAFDVPDDYLPGPHKNRIPLGIERRKQVKYIADYVTLVDNLARRNADKYPVVLRRFLSAGEPMVIRAVAQPVPDKGTNLAVLDSAGRVVAVAENEWGATLIAVAHEARGRGLGKVLARVWHDLNPSFDSGGMTSAGSGLMSTVWADRVREFMSNGWYSQLVRDGRMTRARVDEIVADLPGRAPPRAPVAPSTPDPLIMSDGSTFIVVYDRAVLSDPSLLDDPDDRYIYGHALLRDDPRVGTYVFSVDYDRSFADLTTRAILQLARDNGDRLFDGDGYHDILEGVDAIPGVQRDGDYIVVSRDVLPLRTLSTKERASRRAVDPHGEVEVSIMERADAKWR